MPGGQGWTVVGQKLAVVPYKWKELSYALTDAKWMGEADRRAREVNGLSRSPVRLVRPAVAGAAKVVERKGTMVRMVVVEKCMLWGMARMNYERWVADQTQDVLKRMECV